MSRYSCFLLTLCYLSVPASSRSEVVINEIFYHSPADHDALEFVEIFNSGAEEVALSDWKFSKGIDYTFPADTRIGAGGYLVLCRDAALFKEFYKRDADGQYSKSLDNGGEVITLRNAEGEKIDSVKYDDASPWPKSADGYSASLERICPTAEQDDVSNWAPSVLSENSNQPSGSPGEENSVYSAALPPVIHEVSALADVCSPGEKLTVRAMLGDDAPASAVELLYRVAAPGEEGEEVSVAMQPVDGTYSAIIPGQISNRIIRYRVKATSSEGAVRISPHPNAIRPAHSVYVMDKLEIAQIPVAHFFNVGKSEFERGAAYRESHSQSRSRGGFNRGRLSERPEISDEDRLRMEVLGRLSDESLQKKWTALTLTQALPVDKWVPLAGAFRKGKETLDQLRSETQNTKDIRAFQESLDDEINGILDALNTALTKQLSDAQRQVLEDVPEQSEAERGRGRGGRGFPNPAEMLPRIFNVEASWFRLAMNEEIDASQLEKLATVHRAAIAERGKLGEDLAAGEEIDMRAVFGDAMELADGLQGEVASVLSEDQRRAMNFREPRGGNPFSRRGGPGGRSSAEPETPLPAQGRSALIYTDPETKQTQLFDFVNITQRKSGYKVRLHKDRPLNGMTTLNVLFESNEATTLNEVLAYELYRQAGNATVEAGFARVVMDGEVAGYHLWFEQPNGAFFRRNEIDDDGNLYKLIWMGNHRPSRFTPEDKMPERMDIVGRHEKMTHPHDGYDDLVELIEELESAKGDDEKTWKVIQKHFEVDQVVNYFAVNSLLSHWDGFFNNYFLYHDRKGTKKWSMYPWDQDSTWSMRMGDPEELSRLQLDFGAEGARPEGSSRGRDRGGFRGFGGGRGGPAWWRDGGDISRPLLANPEFEKRFRARLKFLAETVFNEEQFGPRIEAVHASIKPEVILRAETFGRNSDDAVDSFEETIGLLRQHLKLRQAYVLEQLNQ